MKTQIFLILVSLSATALSAQKRSEIIPIKEAEASAVVKAQEEAREKAKDARENQLLNARITSTAVADMGDKKIILNRVRPRQSTGVKTAKNPQKDAVFDEAYFTDTVIKEQKCFTLSGTVREGISELWWTHEGHSFKVFTNANFLYLSGIGDFSDEEIHYSVFSIITESYGRSPARAGAGANWQPTQSDFTSGELEYYVVESSGIQKLDADALRPIILMMKFYSENSEQIKVSYENAEKMSNARAAYLKANPPKKRDVIINSAPINKSIRKSIAE